MLAQDVPVNKMFTIDRWPHSLPYIRLDGDLEMVEGELCVRARSVQTLRMPVVGVSVSETVSIYPLYFVRVI